MLLRQRRLIVARRTVPDEFSVQRAGRVKAGALPPWLKQLVTSRVERLLARRD
jgi:hypothetical protein